MRTRTSHPRAPPGAGRRCVVSQRCEAGAGTRDNRRRRGRFAHWRPSLGVTPSRLVRRARGRAARRRAARRRPAMKNRRRPTLPGPLGPSTIGAEGLNFSVRNGKRCFPLAKATGKKRETASPGPSKLHSATRASKIRQALGPLVPVSFGRYRPSRSGLSTWWSTRGLTPSRGWENSS